MTGCEALGTTDFLLLVSIGMTGCKALGTTGFLLLGVDILISASIDEHISSSVKLRLCSVLLSKHRRFETSDCLISGLVLHMMKIIAFYKKENL
jgi:hypothetical protein